MYNEQIVTEHEKKAMELFFEGCNCAQSVFTSFCDLTGYSKEEALKISSSFGGGMGGLRETCGAVSGMLMVCGVLFGVNVESDFEAKKEHYKKVRTLAEEFRRIYGTIICRELLMKSKLNPPGLSPSLRTEEYYRTRPCAKVCGVAAHILDEFLLENPPVCR